MDFDEVLLQKSHKICSNLPNLVCFAQIPPDLDALMRSVLLVAPATVAVHDASCLRVLLRLLRGRRSWGALLPSRRGHAPEIQGTHEVARGGRLSANRHEPTPWNRNLITSLPKKCSEIRPGSHLGRRIKKPRTPNNACLLHANAATTRTLTTRTPLTTRTLTTRTPLTRCTRRCQMHTREVPPTTHLPVTAYVAWHMAWQHTAPARAAFTVGLSSVRAQQDDR